MPKRQRIKGHYVTRRGDGTFKNWTSVGKSINLDKQRTADKPYRKGYGHKTDHKSKVGKKLKKKGNSAYKPVRRYDKNKVLRKLYVKRK